MLAYDVFTDDIFQATEVTEALGNITYIPQGLNRMGLFEPEPIRVDNFQIYKKDETLELVKITERGTQGQQLGRDNRTLRPFRTYRLMQEARITANQIRNLFSDSMPFAYALARAEEEVAARQTKMMRQLELTKEYHRMAAVNGYVLDSDGSVVYDLFAEFGIVQPAAILFNFATLVDGQFREYLAQQIIRPMARQAAARWVEGQTEVAALCGDNFYDRMVRSAEVRETYKSDMELRTLREKRIWDSFYFGGVTWYNYRGTNDNATIRVAPNEVKFFPVGAIDVFKEVRSPAEDFTDLGELGREFYGWVSPDYRPNMFQWVDCFLASYQFIFCQSPDLLMRGQLQ